MDRLEQIKGRLAVSHPTLKDTQWAVAEVERLHAWVDDLQSGMFINCVYCGHCYGPRDEVPTTMADALTSHIETCPKHPLSYAKAEIERLRLIIADVEALTERADQQQDLAEALALLEDIARRLLDADVPEEGG